ncbi:MAG: hypothetical protein HOZ81_49720 [Streptomyces sp.]|nr:hypothetical protein [Streptomyces sp.]
MAGFKTWASGEILTAADLNRLAQYNYVVKPSNESVTSSTAMQNDDHLVLAVSANTDYWVEAFIVYEAANGGDIAIGWSVPAGATGWWLHDTVSQYPADGMDGIERRNIPDWAGTRVGKGLGVGFKMVAPSRGVLRVAGTPGNLQLRWAQGASSGTATTVWAASMLRISKLT